MNLDELTLDELLVLQDEVKKAIEKQKDSVIGEINAKMKAMDITIADLSAIFAPSAKGNFKRKPKYRNPANPQDVWGGVGKMPRWFKAQLDKGINKEDMLIPS